MSKFTTFFEDAMKFTAVTCLMFGIALLLGLAPLRAADAPAKELSLDLGGGVKLDLVLIPAGKFMMGSAKPGQSPAHEITITQPFYMSKFLVTQAQFQQITGGNPSKYKNSKDNPVETVGWELAQTFCKKASDHTKSTVTLPTEAQWEYACRAGTTTAFNTGDTDADLEKAGWYSTNAQGTTHPCGSKAPNAWGLYDMHGNVWEWCSDWFGDDYYAKSPAQDPTGPEQGQLRVMRGGALDTPAGCCASAYRYSFEPARKFDNMGFRVVVAVK